MPEPLPQAVADVVREHMQHAGVTGYQLIQMTGLPRASVYRWLNDQHPIGLHELSVIAAALGTTAVAIMGEAEPRARRLGQTE